MTPKFTASRPGSRHCNNQEPNYCTARSQDCRSPSKTLVQLSNHFQSRLPALRCFACKIYAHPQAGNCALESCICMNKMSNCMCRLLLVREITCFASVNCCFCMHIYLFAVFILGGFDLAVCVWKFWP